MSEEIINEENVADAKADVLEDSFAKAMKRFDDAEVKDVEAKEETSEEKTSAEEQEMSWPLPVYPLVAKFDVQKVELEDATAAIVLAVYTGAGAAFGLLSREGALALSSRLKKIANSVID